MNTQIEIISPLIIKGGEPTEAAVEAHRELVAYAQAATGYEAVCEASERLKRWADFVEAERKRIKAPILDAGRGIDAAAKALDVSAETDRLKKLRFDFERAAREAAEAAARAAAEAARLEAEERAREAAEWGLDASAVVAPPITAPAVILPPATTTVRKTYVVVIDNLEMVPREYMVPEMKMIHQALCDGKQVEGCRLVPEEKIVNKARR